MSTKQKNRSDDGIVHFDASTNQNFRDVPFDFVCMGIKLNFVVKIPQTIFRALNSADFDEMRPFIARTFPEYAKRMVMQEMRRAKPPTLAEMAENAEIWVKMQVCEELYTRFTLRQSKAGNAVWATPETMQEIGQRPEEDDQYLM